MYDRVSNNYIGILFIRPSSSHFGRFCLDRRGEAGVWSLSMCIGTYVYVYYLRSCFVVFIHSFLIVVAVLCFVLDFQD